MEFIFKSVNALVGLAIRSNFVPASDFYTNPPPKKRINPWIAES